MGSGIFFGVCLGLLIGPFGASPQPVQRPGEGSSPGITVLQPGKKLERQIAGEETQRFEIALATGQYLHLVLDQRGVDVVVKATGPDGKQIVKMDCLLGAWGPEEISILSESAGKYGFEIRCLSKEAASGRYEIRVAELRKAVPGDRNRLVAQAAYEEGEYLVDQQTAESMRRAIDKYSEAASQWQAIGNSHGQGIAILAIGNAYFRLGETQEGAEYNRRAVVVFEPGGDKGELAAALNGVGIACYGAGETRKSLEALEQALVLRHSMGDRSGEGNTRNNIGVIYSSLGDHSRALDYLNESLALRHAAGDRIGEAGTLSNLGQAYFRVGDFKTALDWLERALPLARSVGDRRREGVTLNRIGKVYDALGEKEKSLDYFNQALSILRTMGDRSSEAETLLRVGSVYSSFGEKQKALDYYMLALAISREIGDRAAEGETLYNIARAERDRGNLLKARKQIEAALEVFDSLRSKVGTWDLRVSYLASVHGSYEFYVDLLMRLQQREAAEAFGALALKASEGARARGLLELLTESRAEIREGVDAGLVAQERTLQRTLDDKASGQIRLMNDKHTEKEAVAAAGEIELLTGQLERLRAQIQASSPHYAALTQPRALTVEEIRRELDRDSLLLEYALGDERSFLWVISPDGMKSFELAKRKEVETAARRVYDLLNARNRSIKFESAEDRKARLARADAEYPAAAAALSQILLAPAATQFGTKRLLIVADGALQYVPFAALPSPAFPNEFVPLAAEHEIVALPSASVLAVLRRELAGRPPAPKVVAVLADPVFESGDERVAAGGGVKRPAKPGTKSVERPSDSDLVRSAQDLGLVEGGQIRIPRLPFTRNEAKSIIALSPAGSREALDFDANRAAATSGELGQYRFVHFATHGFLNSLHPDLSGLVLSLVDHEGREQDGFLSALEVFNLKLPADLVVLSGCRTGLGKEIKGEGLVGLTRAFMYAGAARVLVSLWDVNDEATAELMTRFYGEMLGEKHLSPAAALRAAQLSIWKEKRWEFPYYWAAFVLQGEPR